MLRAGTKGHDPPEVDMLDLLYVLGTLAFFAAMVGYVHGCQRLGRSADTEDPR